MCEDMGSIPTPGMVVVISTFRRLGRKFESLRPTYITYEDFVSTNLKKKERNSTLQHETSSGNKSKAKALEAVWVGSATGLQ